MARRVQLPDWFFEYKGFAVIRSHGRFYGVPGFLDPEYLQLRGLVLAHPAVRSASTIEELKGWIDGYDIQHNRPETIGSYEGYNLVRLRGWVHGVPRASGFADLYLEEDCRLAGVVSGRTVEEVQARIHGVLATEPVEFAGWLPVYEASGNCGRHPQFAHTGNPPPGYRFTCSAPGRRYRGSAWQKVLGAISRLARRAARGAWVTVRPLTRILQGGAAFSPRARLSLLWAMVRMVCRLWWKGGRVLPVFRFLRTRHYQSQLLLGRSRGLVFLTSMPYTFCQNPWVVEIEDPTTLFYPLIQNGQTTTLAIGASPYFPIVKALLESDQCRGIVTHMKSTARMIPTLFGSAAISAKVRYAPLGVKLPERWQRHEESESINLLFINSWCQVPGNFCLRGGLDVLDAFAVLRERYPQVRLTLRTRLPPLDGHYHRILESGWVRVIDRFLSPEEMETLLAESHVFLLPAARVHIVSLLQAMSYGLALVTSDGWGFEEYVEDERNGLVVKGRYGKVSWADEQAGILREDYAPMFTSDPDVAQGLVEAVSRLVEDRSLRRRLGRAAREDVATKYSLEQWNRHLSEVFDRARGLGMVEPGPGLPARPGNKGPSYAAVPAAPAHAVPQRRA
jgi:glycosyltransferase involved in cell wall biosynthesis